MPLLIFLALSIVRYKFAHFSSASSCTFLLYATFVPPGVTDPGAQGYGLPPPAVEKLKIHKSSGARNSPRLLKSSGKCNSQDLFSGDEHTSRQKYKHFFKKKRFEKNKYSVIWDE
jgi:hypothetical protein